MASRTSMKEAERKVGVPTREAIRTIQSIILARALSEEPFEQALTAVSISRVLNKLEKEVEPVIREEIKWHYQSSALEATNTSKRLGRTLSGALDEYDRLDIKFLQDDALNKYSDALRGAFNSAQDVITQVRRKRFERIFVEGRLYGKTKKELKDEIVADLKKDFFAIRDKSGRKWELDTYAEMLVRTKTREATNVGMTNRLKREGYDLVQVSANPPGCPLCRPWSGEILSMTGNTPGYSTVDEAEAYGLMHPNCRHRYLPYHAEIEQKVAVS